MCRDWVKVRERSEMWRYMEKTDRMNDRVDSSKAE